MRKLWDEEVYVARKGHMLVAFWLYSTETSIGKCIRGLDDGIK